MYKEIDIDKWKRKNLYYFFKKYDNPFYNICSNIEITELYKFTKENHVSFFLANLFLSIKTINEIEEFRYRIKDDKVLLFDNISASSTILSKDYNFKFCDFEYFESFNEFNTYGISAIEKTLKENKQIGDKPERIDVIHYTTIPWISLTSMSHARNYNSKDSIPKIVFGKYFNQGNKVMLPICVEVHHSFVDGYHVGKYLELFRNNIISSKKILML